MKRYPLLQVRCQIGYLKHSCTVFIFQHHYVIVSWYRAFHCLFMKAFLNPAPNRWSRSFHKTFFSFWRQRTMKVTHTNWELVAIQREFALVRAACPFFTQESSKITQWNKYVPNEISSRVGILLFCSKLCAENRQVFVALSTNIHTSRENNYNNSHQLRRWVPHISSDLCHSLWVPWDHQHTFWPLRSPNWVHP